MTRDTSKKLVEDLEMGVNENTSDEFLIETWMTDIETRAKSTNLLSQEEQLWKTTTIYKVPDFPRKLNSKAFTPEFVSFGPFHNGKQELQLMEVHKERALIHFVKRVNQPLEKIVQEVAKIITKLREAYNFLDDKWKKDNDAFLKMMIVDGCFMLEVLQFSVDTERGYSDTDPYFSPHGINHKWPYIRRDMLLIENQLPLFLLKVLALFQTLHPQDAQDTDSYINKLVLNFVGGDDGTTTTTALSNLHALDLFRQSLLTPKPEPPLTLRCRRQPSSYITTGYTPMRKYNNYTTTTYTPMVIRCAVELHEAGVSFKKSKTKSLNDVSFDPKTGIFQLPFLIVDDATECIILNVMAFEYLHANVEHDVTSYVCIMNEIINSANDVSLLHHKGVILNSLGCDEAVAELFNRITKDVTVDPDSNLLQVRSDVSQYYGKRRNRWRANLIHTYFKNPWSALSLAGALLLIVLTIIQTVCAIHGLKW